MAARPGKDGTGGKSELHRVRRSVTRSPGNGKESATERETTPLFRGTGEKVAASAAPSGNRRKVKAHQCLG